MTHTFSVKLVCEVDGIAQASIVEQGVYRDCQASKRTRSVNIRIADNEDGELVWRGSEGELLGPSAISFLKDKGRAAYIVVSHPRRQSGGVPLAATGILAPSDERNVVRCLCGKLGLATDERLGYQFFDTRDDSAETYSVDIELTEEDWVDFSRRFNDAAESPCEAVTDDGRPIRRVGDVVHWINAQGAVFAAEIKRVWSAVAGGVAYTPASSCPTDMPWEWYRTLDAESAKQLRQEIASVLLSPRGLPTAEGHIQLRVYGRVRDVPLGIPGKKYYHYDCCAVPNTDTVPSGFDLVATVEAHEWDRLRKSAYEGFPKPKTTTDKINQHRDSSSS